MTVNAKTEEFQHVELFGKYALFTNGCIDRSTVPEGGYCYDLLGPAISKKVWRSTMQARS